MMNAKGLLLAILNVTAPMAGSEQGPCSLPEKAERMYAPGEVRVSEIFTPKYGFVGSPYTTGAPAFRRATKDEHFDKRFVRIKVFDKRKTKDHIRIVFRLDEVDERAAVIREAIYFAYLDVFAEGARMIDKAEDDNLRYAYMGMRYMLPFPLTCTRPPALGFLKSTADGYVESTGRGVVYFKKALPTGDSLLEMEATSFQKNRGPGVPVRWYVSDASNLARDDAETTILFRETQKWKRPDDWLWFEMVRHDRDANILMRCRLIEPEKPLQEKPPTQSHKRKVSPDTRSHSLTPLFAEKPYADRRIPPLDPSSPHPMTRNRQPRQNPGPSATPHGSACDGTNACGSQR